MTKFKWSITAILIVIFFSASFVFVNKAADKVTHLKGAVTITHKIHSDMLMMRRNEKDFLSRYDKAYLDRFRNNYAIIQSDIQKLQAELEHTPLLEKMPDFQDAIEAYYQSFNKLAALQEKIGLGPYLGFYGKLRDDAHRIEKILVFYDQPELMNILLTLRRKEKDFMLRNLEQYVTQFVEYIKIFESRVTDSKLSAEDKEKALILLKSYHMNFVSYSQSLIEKGLNNHDGLLGETTQRAHVLDRLLSQFEHQLLDASISMEVKTDRHTRILMLIFVLGILAIALIPFIFFIISNQEKQKTISHV